MTSKHFYDRMVVHVNHYRDDLLLTKSNETIKPNCAIISEFINYLYNDHLISDYEQITVSMANSKFHNHYEKINKEVISKQTMKNILQEFFIFIHKKYGIRNEKLMKGFQK